MRRPSTLMLIAGGALLIFAISMLLRLTDPDETLRTVIAGAVGGLVIGLFVRRAER